jgi:hypothetical protein
MREMRRDTLVNHENAVTGQTDFKNEMNPKSLTPISGESPDMMMLSNRYLRLLTKSGHLTSRIIGSDERMSL